MPAPQEVVCAVQPVVAVSAVAAVDGVVSADENRPAGHVVQVRSALSVPGAE